MPSRFARYVERLTDLVASASGETSSELRIAVQARARRLVHGEPPAASDAIPASLSAYVDAVLRHAYRVTDADVETLRQSHSDDAIFETTVNAAVAAGVMRLDRALAAMKEGGR